MILYDMIWYDMIWYDMIWFPCRKVEKQLRCLCQFYPSVSSCVSSACRCLCWRSCTDCTGMGAHRCGNECGALVCSPAQHPHTNITWQKTTKQWICHHVGPAVCNCSGLLEQSSCRSTVWNCMDSFMISMLQLPPSCGCGYRAVNLSLTLLCSWMSRCGWREVQ